MSVKVIELIPTMNTGGAETMVKDYALLMNKDKVVIKVVVLDHRYGSENERLLDENGIETLYLNDVIYGNRKDLNVIQKVHRTLARYYYFRKYVLKEKPDVIHVHLVFKNYLKMLPLKKMNIRLIYTVHNVMENYFDKRPGLKPKYFEYCEAKQLVQKHNMTLVALHDDMNKELREYFHTENVVTVNNGIVMENFDVTNFDRKEKRLSLGISDDEFLVGNVGRLFPQKNHEMIFKIFMELLKVRPKSKLLLIGKGPLKDNIKKCIRENGITDKVIMLENRSDIPELMNAMDVFLFPSRWEGYGNVLLEAQCVGLRCVISDRVPKSVRLTDLVVPLPLEAPLSEWVETLTDDSIRGIPVGNLQDHDMKNCIQKLEKLYVNEGI